MVVVVVGNAVEIGVPAVDDMEGIVGELMDDDWMDDDGSTGVAFNAARIAGSCSACAVVGCNSAARPSELSEFHREDKPSGMTTAFRSREIALPLAMVDVFLSDMVSIVVGVSPSLPPRIGIFIQRQRTKDKVGEEFVGEFAAPGCDLRPWPFDGD